MLRQLSKQESNRLVNCEQTVHSGWTHTANRFLAHGRADRESRDFPSATITDEKYLTSGIAEDGTPGEIFIVAPK